MKKALAFLLVLCLVLTAVGSGLAASASNSSSLSGVKPFKFEHKKQGIGRGICPVYSAPYAGAYRAANGKASVDTNHSLDIGGFYKGWLMVRYSTNKGGTRVGWIPSKYVRKVETSMYPHFSSIKMTAAKTINVTDNNLDPYDTSGYFAQLQPGDTYYIIGRYNYYKPTDLWYIRFNLNGKVAQGFIPVE